MDFIRRAGRRAVDSMSFSYKLEPFDGPGGGQDHTNH